MRFKKLYNTRMNITCLELGIIGLAFVLTSIFDANADSTVLMDGLLFVVVGNILNLVRLRQNKKNSEG
ncbi:MAG: hypothetical protein IKH57_14030 [Clostridia bacterium]|nr:hypothetical protein [Clostridia bacterium]